MTNAPAKVAAPEASATAQPTCRFCSATLTTSFVDLGMSPLCQTQISQEQLNHMEPFYPLHAYVCADCHLVQLEEFVAPDEIFSTEYPYFSSYSDSWVEHARLYTEMMSERFGIGDKSLVMEIASNDGYLLQHFVARGTRVLGIEPAGNVAAAAREKGIDTTVQFFGLETATKIAQEHGQPNLLLGNNVLAHVPDINDFVSGMKKLLGPGGVITMEFPHLVQLMQQNQFDTIYHEHFSYLSCTTVQAIFSHWGLELFDVEEIPTHGGSLRIFARHKEDDTKPVSERLSGLLARESEFGITSMQTYAAFEAQVKQTKRNILRFLIEAREQGKTVVGYGAPGKGNTLLNYCGIRTDLLDYTVDRNPHKNGTYTPGTHIPIHHPDKIFETRPDYVFILPWNLTDEIVEQTAAIREWGGKWVRPIPEVQVID